MPRSAPSFSLAVSPVLCIFAALMLLVLPLQWVVAAAAAAAFHEFCHYFAVRIMGYQIFMIRIGFGGAVMETEAMTPSGELICALAGPLGALLLLLCVRWLPRVAVCAAAQSIYNLLPVYPLDGGRALHCCSMLLSAPWLHKVCVFLEFATLILLGILGIYATFVLKLGLLPLIIPAALYLKRKNTLQTRLRGSTIVTA